MAAGTIPFYCWQQIFAGGDNQIHFFDPVLGANQTVALVLNTPFFANDNGGANDLIQALENALNAPIGGGVYNVNFLPNSAVPVQEFSGRIRILVAGGEDTLLISNAAWTLNENLIGFQTGIDKTSVAGILDSDFQCERGWFPEEIFTFDSEVYPESRSSGGVIMDGFTTRRVRWALRHRREVLHDIIRPNKVFQDEELANRAFESFERFYKEYTTGRQFEFHPDMTNPILDTGDRRYVVHPGRDADDWLPETRFATFRRYWIRMMMLLAETKGP